MIFLSLYPLTSRFIEQLSFDLNKPENFISLANVASSYKNLIKFLFSLKPQKLFLCLEDRTMTTVQSILLLSAFLTRSKEIFLCYGDGSFELVSRSRILLNLISFIRPTLISMWNVIFCTVESFFIWRRQILKVPCDLSIKNILYLKTNYWLGVQAGGSIGHIAGVVNAFMRKKCAVSYGTFDMPVMINKDVDIIKVDLKHGFGVLYEANIYTLNRQFFKELSKKKQSYDLIYQRLSLGNYTGVLLSRLFRIPLILEYNGSELWVSKNWGKPLQFAKLAERAEEICLKHAHLIVVVSEVLKQELLEKGVDEEKIIFYPNCVDPDIFNFENFKDDEKEKLRQEIGLIKKDTVATFIGTFGKWHGIEILANAIQYLYQNHLEWMKKHHLRFLLIGDGVCMNSLKITLKDPIEAGFVLLTGLIPQNKAPLYLSLSDIFLSPHCLNPDGSRFFGSPTKLFEYMSMGKPILASNLEQIGDVLKPGILVDKLTAATIIKDETSILCEPNSETDIVKGLMWIINHYEEAKKLGYNSHHKAIRLYTWDIYIQIIMKALKNIK
ncbi:MAG: glycosyltransferase [Janthinobacterium lividum]